MLINIRKVICVWILVMAMSVAAAAKSTRKKIRSVVGIASYYGREHRGRRMASGKRFDDRKLTAASRTLPLGSRARVTSLSTGRSVVVDITDRGPFGHRLRIIDVSTAAARVLGMLSRGTDRVLVEPVS